MFISILDPTKYPQDDMMMNMKAVAIMQLFEDYFDNDNFENSHHVYYGSIDSTLQWKLQLLA